MPLDIKTTKELKDQFIANFQAALNQNIPAIFIAFVNVVSGITATIFTSLLKYAAERTVQNFALTASLWTLRNVFGVEYDVAFRDAEAAILSVRFTGTNGTVIQVGTEVRGDSNGVTYATTAIGTIGVSEELDLEVTADEVGIEGNLPDDATLSLVETIPGADNVVTVLSTVSLGTEDEGVEVYRQRILNAIRNPGGGGNTADYKAWAEEVSGVKEAFPYSGRADSNGEYDEVNSKPGDRLVFVEADDNLKEADGSTPASLLLEVRESLNYDPATGISRPALGDIDATLWVETVQFADFYTQITNLDVTAEQEIQIKADIEAAQEAYYLTVRMFVSGLTPVFERKDQITKLTVAENVQGVLSAAGASAQEVEFGQTLGGPFLPGFKLNPGQLSRLADTDGVTYV